MKIFPNQARVCFVGDSITHTGVYIKHIVAYYKKHFPTLAVEFYNCGIAGGNLGNTIKVFEEDIATYDPTHIVLMIGVNDSERQHLKEPASENRYQKLLSAYKKFKNNMEQFYQITRERNIELMLCTPMPYAEYIKSDVEPLHGGYALIQGYAEFVRDFAKTKGLELCDYHIAATKYMQSENLYMPDHVHPNVRGHVLMAKMFLAAQNIDYTTEVAFTNEIEEWYSVTQKVRNIMATEFLMLPRDRIMTDAERQAAALKRYADMKAGTYSPGNYCSMLLEEYVTEKSRQTELIETVKHLMKCKL